MSLTLSQGSQRPRKYLHLSYKCPTWHSDTVMTRLYSKMSTLTLAWIPESPSLEPMEPENLLCASHIFIFIFVYWISFFSRIKILTGELSPFNGQVNRNGRLRVYVLRPSPVVSPSRWHTSVHSGYFAQHHVDTLVPTMTPVQFLASKFPGKSEQEYRGHLGNFQISGMTGFVVVTKSSFVIRSSYTPFFIQIAADWNIEWRSEVACGVCSAVVAAASYIVARWGA